MSLRTPKAVFSASERQYTAAGGDVQVAWGGSNESLSKGIDTRIGKANAVLRELYCSCSVVTKREFSKNTKLSVFNRSSFRSSPVVMNLR